MELKTYVENGPILEFQPNTTQVRHSPIRYPDDMHINITQLNSISIDGKEYNSLANAFKATDPNELGHAILAYEGALLKRVADAEASVSKAKTDTEAVSAELANAIAKRDAALQAAEATRKELTAVAAELASAKDVIEKSRAFGDEVLARSGKILADGKITDEERVTALAELHNYASMPAREREAEALKEQRAKLDAQIAALQVK